ncbi:MAG: hypothetical protein WKG07_43275 [Hymenobacter sp.]
MLAEAYYKARLPHEREHVTPYFKTNPAASHVLNYNEVNPFGDFSRYRITLDTSEDYAVLRWLIEQKSAHKLAVARITDLFG